MESGDTEPERTRGVLRPRGESPTPGFLVALVLLAVVAVALALALTLRGQEHTGALQILGGTSVGNAEAPLYPAHDRWARYLADERTCPGGEAVDAPLEQQLDTMLCLVDYARGRRRLPPLTLSAPLTVSAGLKGEDILRCDRFAHAPCGGDAGDVVRRAGYDGAFGENLYVGEGRTGSPRVALDGWLNSPEHRANLFRPEWRVQSLYLAKVPRLGSYRNATLWVSHFGDR